MPPKSLFLVIFLLLALIASLTLALRITVFTGKAYTRTDTTIALENSYLFASPIQAKADGQELIRITVFILDNRGLGAAKHTITLNTPNNISIVNSSNTDLSVVASAKTDDTGKAIFDLKSSFPGRYTLTATIDNRTEIPQKVNVVFY